MGVDEVDGRMRWMGGWMGEAFEHERREAINRFNLKCLASIKI
jgi:hypothetical protein